MDERGLKVLVREIIGTDQTLDDCAIFACREGPMVATTDMLHEATDFPAGMSDWQIGWMSAAVTLSDIAAMGARPSLLLLAVGLDRPGRLRQILTGAKACCDSCGAALSGGDLDAHDELTIVSSGIGSAEGGRIVRRSGSVPGDLICVTGPLGRAQAALDGHSRYRRCLLEPVPRVREGMVLASAGVSSMMDISDGLILSLYDMLDANQCGYSIDSDLLPIIEGLPREASREYALFGGGDFELLFTCRPGLPLPGLAYHPVGTVIPDHLVLVDGRPAAPRGYLHRWDG